MTTLFAIPFAANNAHGVPGLSVLDPANTWSPYGTYATPPNQLRHVILKYYTGDAAEYAAFQAGGSNGLDIGDDGTAGNGPPAAQWPVYDNTCATCGPTSPGIDWTFTLAQGSANWQGMYFNGASSTWGFWGCNWNFYNSACGREMRQAFAHLINRPDFVTANDAGGKAAFPIWDDAPANKVLSTCFSPTTVSCDATPPAPAVGCPTLPTIDNKACTFSSPGNTGIGFCLWDTLSNTGCTSTTGPYLVGGTGLTTGFPGIPAASIAACPFATPDVGNPGQAAIDWHNCNNDFALAAEHLVQAGVANGIDANYQVGAHLTNAAGVAAHHLRSCTRSSQPRKTMGLGWTGALKLLLGSGGNPNTNAVDVQLGNIVVCGFDKVFSEPPTSPIDDWDMYTYGYAAGGPFPDFLFTQFSTKFSFTPGGCGGTAAFTADLPSNPTFTCIDGRGANGNADAALLSAVSATSDETAFDHKMALDSNSALDILGKDVASIPVHTQIVRVPALRAVAGIPNTKGLGFANPFILNLAHKGPYTPVNPQFQFDCDTTACSGSNPPGSDDTLRWGQAQPISFLNAYQASTVWEFNSISQVYDSLFGTSLVRPQQVFCEMCQGSIVTNTPVICGTPPTTCTSYAVRLRQNLRFQDGTQILAKDIASSFLNERDFATVLSGNFGLLDHITVSSSNDLDLTIVMVGQFVGNLVNLSGGLVLPRARWDCPSTGISSDGTTPCTGVNSSNVPVLNGVLQNGSGTSTDCVTTPLPAARALVCAGAYNVGSASSPVFIPQVDQFKAGPGYDPSTDIVTTSLGSFGNFLGSGLLACISDSGTVGTGCEKDSNGNPSGQAIDPGGSLRLTVYDQTASLGPFAQFTRLNNPAWSPTSRSGQQQELSYADADNNNEVTISDLTSADLCEFAPGATPNCTLSAYNYWTITGTGTISIQTAIVASHYHDGGVLPTSWNSGACPNINGVFVTSGPDLGSTILDNVVPYTCH